MRNGESELNRADTLFLRVLVKTRTLGMCSVSNNTHPPKGMEVREQVY
jgi:hypothetical protein